MAKNLNKSRIRDSRILLIAVLGICFLTKTLIGYETVLHESIEFIGYFLICICAMGRLYSTAFLGGYKNDKLITHGAFSIVRNPLYFFSLLGITGIALMSGHILIISFLPPAFFIMYHFLIKREEEFLLQTFGDDYRSYTNTTPRLLPNLKLYNVPEKIEFVPKYLNKAFFDAIWWFAAFPLYEFAETLQEKEIIKPLFMLL